MEHHVEITVWALVWCFCVFSYLMWHLLNLWINEHVIRDDNDDNDDDNDTYLIQFWLGEDFNDIDNN